jgi:hypothetical protein
LECKWFFNQRMKFTVRRVSRGMDCWSEGVEVGGGIFGRGECGGSAGRFDLGFVGWNLAGHGLIMAGGGDEMAVTGVKIEIIEALESRERILRDLQASLDHRTVFPLAEMPVALPTLAGGEQERRCDPSILRADRRATALPAWPLRNLGMREFH